MYVCVFRCTWNMSSISFLRERCTETRCYWNFLFFLIFSSSPSCLSLSQCLFIYFRLHDATISILWCTAWSGNHKLHDFCACCMTKGVWGSFKNSLILAFSVFQKIEALDTFRWKCNKSRWNMAEERQRNRNNTKIHSLNLKCMWFVEWTAHVSEKHSLSLHCIWNALEMCAHIFAFCSCSHNFMFRWDVFSLSLSVSLCRSFVHVMLCFVSYSVHSSSCSLAI